MHRVAIFQQGFLIYINTQMAFVSKLDVFILIPMRQFNAKGHNLNNSHLERVEWPARTWSFLTSSSPETVLRGCRHWSLSCRWPFYKVSCVNSRITPCLLHRDSHRDSCSCRLVDFTTGKSCPEYSEKSQRPRSPTSSHHCAPPLAEGTSTPNCKTMTGHNFKYTRSSFMEN